MRQVQITEGDIEAALGGEKVILPASDGGLWQMWFGYRAIRLTRLTERVIMPLEGSTREGEALETPPVVS